jgi:Bifunctional DNA primase/polymerase, N-terminal
MIHDAPTTNSGGASSDHIAEPLPSVALSPPAISAATSSPESSADQRNRTQNIAEAIGECLGSGLSVVPIDHSTKAPAAWLLPIGANGKRSWSPCQKNIVDFQTALTWVKSGIEAFAVVGGMVSGGLCILDFDVPRFYERWRDLVGNSADGLPVQRTGGGGYQAFFRCPNPGGNQKLAWAVNDNEENGREIAIETRGEGGYAVVAPSRHPSGAHYQMINLNLGDIPEITQEQADALIAAARSLDEAPFTYQQLEHARLAQLKRRNTQSNVDVGGVIGRYNSEHPIEDLLEKHGYVRGANGKYVRPGGKSESVSVREGRSCHWSTNDSLNDGKFRDGMGVHDAFSIYCILEHGNDLRAAVRAAAEDFGIELPAAASDQNIMVTVGDEAAGINFELRLDLICGDRHSKALVRAYQSDNLLHADRLDLASATRRKSFAKSIAGKLIAAQPENSTKQRDAIAQEIEKTLLAKLDQFRRTSPGNMEQSEEPDHDGLLEAMPDETKGEAEQILEDPELMQRIATDIAAIGVAGEEDLALTTYLLGISRLLNEPLSAITNGHTSTGKSFVAERVSRLFPPEAIIRATQMTPQALFHMPPGSLKHRWVVAGERSRLETNETAEATRALREMRSSGRLSKLMPMQVGNKIETVLIEQEGPIAYTESTTMARIFDEDLNRSLLVSTDEREEQTHRILKAQAAARSRPRGDVEAIIARHHAMQRMIATVQAEVTIPFADRLADLFPAKRPEARRAFGQLMSAVQAVALLHCRQRERDCGGRILGTRRDYEIARILLLNPMARAIGGAVSDGARRFSERLAVWARSEIFTGSAAYAHEKFSSRHVRGWLIELTYCGFLEVVEEGRPGKQYSYRIARVGPGASHGVHIVDGATVLPTVDELFSA